MSAPLSPHPPPIVWVIVCAIVAVAIAAPFGRREDWIGWLAFFVVMGAAISLWAVLFAAFFRTFVEWCRKDPARHETGVSGRCYEGHIYELAWDRERFALQTFGGRRVIEVPLERLFEVIDADALFLEEDITVKTPSRCIPFPKSRPDRTRLLKLIGRLVQLNQSFRRQIALRRSTFLHRGYFWLPASIAIGVLSILFMRTVPDPRPQGFLWVIGGMAFGLAWYWLIWRFAYGVACLFAARKLHGILAASNRIEE